MRFTLRAARPDDLGAVQAIEAACEPAFLDVGVTLSHTTDWRAVAEEYVAACAEGRLLVAVDSGDAPVGFLCIAASAVDGAAFIHEVDVLPALQGRGIGTALIEAAGAWGAARGRDSIALTTFRAVPWNAPFYRRRGFVEVTEPGPDLSAILDQEVARGLRREERCAMVRQR